jgi:6-phosphogluconolactonase
MDLRGTMSSEPPARRFSDLNSLSRQFAGELAVILASAIEARGTASLVVSGGKSPVTLFEHLRAQPLDWRRVCIALADERWVDPSDANSNERMVRDVLLRDQAAAANFVGLKNGAPSPVSGAAAAWEAIARVPRPFDVVVLGMGDDGHTASLFPDSPNLARALNPAAAAGCIGMISPVAPHERLSLNLTALLDSRRIYLMIIGAAKWLTYAAAGSDGPVEAMPVRAVLRQKNTPWEVLWAP